MTTAATTKAKAADTKGETLRDIYDRLKPKWKSGRAKNFKRWALGYRRQQQRKQKAKKSKTTESKGGPRAKDTKPTDSPKEASA